MSRPRRVRCRRRLTRTALSIVAAVLLVIHAPAPAAAQPAPAPPQVDVGFGRGVTIRAADGTASMNIRARMQMRTTFSGEPGDGRDDTAEMSVRRARLVFQGNANGPALTYYIQLSFSNLDTEADLRLPLRDAYVTWAPHRDMNVRLGQMKVPFSRQRVTSSSALALVDRSIVVSELNLDRDVGVQLLSKDLFGTGRFGYAVGVFGGDGRNRVGRTAGLLYTARLEAWPFGAFDDYSEGDLKRVAAWRLAVGANIGHNQNTNRPRSTIGTPYAAGDFDYTHASVDAVLKTHGFFALGEVMYRHADRDSRLVSVNGSPMVIWSRSGWGSYLQIGYMLTERLDVSARHSRLRPAGNTDPTFARAREAGMGVGYYPNGHDLKIQGDYFRVTDPAAGRPVHQGRLQLQLFF